MTWQKIATNSGMFLMAHLEPWSSDVAKIGKNDAREKKKTVDLRCLEIDRPWENTYSNDTSGDLFLFQQPTANHMLFLLGNDHQFLPGPCWGSPLCSAEISVFDGQKKNTSYQLRVNQINCYGYINNDYFITDLNMFFAVYMNNYNWLVNKLL